MNRKIRGSIVVEAAIVLPLFLFMVISISAIIKGIYTNHIMQNAFNDIATEMSSQYYILYRLDTFDTYGEYKVKLEEDKEYLESFSSMLKESYESVQEVIVNPDLLVPHEGIAKFNDFMTRVKDSENPQEMIDEAYAYFIPLEDCISLIDYHEQIMRIYEKHEDELSEYGIASYFEGLKTVRENLNGGSLSDIQRTGHIIGVGQRYQLIRQELLDNETEMKDILGSDYDDLNVMLMDKLSLAEQVWDKLSKAEYKEAASSVKHFIPKPDINIYKSLTTMDFVSSSLQKIVKPLEEVVEVTPGEMLVKFYNLGKLNAMNYVEDFVKENIFDFYLDRHFVSSDGLSKGLEYLKDLGVDIETLDFSGSRYFYEENGDTFIQLHVTYSMRKSTPLDVSKILKFENHVRVKVWDGGKNNYEKYTSGN